MATRKTTDVQRLVYRMLTENTGIHFLDSGFSNGRMWQRNANKKRQKLYDKYDSVQVYPNGMHEVKIVCTK